MTNSNKGALCAFTLTNFLMDDDGPPQVVLTAASDVCLVCLAGRLRADLEERNDHVGDEL